MQEIRKYVDEKLNELEEYIAQKQYKIKTVIVQVGDCDASNRYIKGKMADCKKVGIECELRKLPEETSEADLLQLLQSYNTDPEVAGYIVQLPLPKHISEAKITEAIDYYKDIDGFTKGSLVNPATPQGILTYLENNNFKFEDANAVVIGRSNIVGKPMARLLLEKNCNITVIHSKTSDQNKHYAMMKADLVVVATGHRNTLVDKDFIDASFEGYGDKVNNHCFIVDVGMNRNDEGKLCGDCEAVTVCEKTPVPGGVGLLTRLALLNNIVKLYEINHK